MSITIRERGTLVFEALQKKSAKGIEAMASAIGISKSSVARHQKGIERRNQYEASHLWESEAGSVWLKQMVCGTIFYFGIKHGIGVGEISKFLKALELEHHVGCSPSALARLKTQLKEQIVAYEAAQSEYCQPQEGQGIVLGSDEVFFGLPILVLMELASGYIFTETQTEGRSYEDWDKAISPLSKHSAWRCHAMVSDGAKALIKLALETMGCVSVPDLFHAMRSLGQPMVGALGRQQSNLNKAFAKANERLSKRISPANREKIQQEIVSLKAQQEELTQDKASYDTAIEDISQILHPFELESGQGQTVQSIEQQLSTPLKSLTTLSSRYGGTKASNAIDTFGQQVPHIAAGIHAWWYWVFAALATQTECLQTQNWVIAHLLPWVYWQQQADKTQQPKLKNRYQQAAQEAAQRLLSDAFTHTLTPEAKQTWLDWAQWMANNYQRTSSAVEGRNGYLTRLHHSGRGFSALDLSVFTIIHNFHLTRPDGTTAAERLFDHEFPDLFEWVVEHMGDLPLARQSKKTQRPNSFHLEGFPA
ncbi:MAG: DNA-binding protein [Moorea sp. SIO3C2]|nr:DNA-binding protein [Moorena sp. SIO3C2]